MAKRVGSESPSHEAKVIGKAKLERLLKQAIANDAHTAEARGELGNAVARAVVDDNLHTLAFGMTKRFAKKKAVDLVAAAEWWYQLKIMVGEHLGLDDVDMLEDRQSENVEDLRSHAQQRREREQSPDVA